MKNLHVPTTITSLVLALFLFSSSYAIFSEAQAIPGVGFGGPVITSIPMCISVIGAPATTLNISIGPPKGGPLLYTPGVSQSFSYGPPVRPGQFVLGKPAPLPAPCLIYVTCPPVPLAPVPPPTVSPCFTVNYIPGTAPGGLPILFHGASL